MENLNKNGNKNLINLEPLINFLTKDVTPLELAKTLEEIEFQYVFQSLCHAIDSGGELRNDTPDNFYTLHHLKEILRECQNAI